MPVAVAVVGELGCDCRAVHVTFKLAVANNEGKKTAVCCPRFQKNLCKFGNDCDKPHNCVICGASGPITL